LNGGWAVNNFHL